MESNFRKDPQLPRQVQDYQLLNVLGKGSNGIVYKATKINEDMQHFYAVKEVKIQNNLSKEKRKDCLQEAEILKSIKHRHIIKLFDSFITHESLSTGSDIELTPQNRKTIVLQKHQFQNGSNLIYQNKRYASNFENQFLYLILEYGERGDLYSMIQNQKYKGKYFSEREIWEIAWQLCLALLHCHKNDIIHRDVKCMNILITKDKCVKLGDLSESTILSNNKYVKTKRIGTPLYLSPEIIKYETYDHRSDIWSLGVVIYHMTTLELPFQDTSIENLMKQILFKNPKPFQVGYSQGLKDFIFSMLEKNKSKRPFISDLFEMFPKQKLTGGSIIGLGAMFGIQSSPIDKENLDFYRKNIHNLERKRIIDGNKLAIRTEFEDLKERVQKINQQEKKKRSMSILANSLVNPSNQNQLAQQQATASQNQLVPAIKIIGNSQNIQQIPKFISSPVKRQFLNRNIAKMLNGNNQQIFNHKNDGNIEKETQYISLSRNLTIKDKDFYKSESQSINQIDEEFTPRKESLLKRGESSIITKIDQSFEELPYKRNTARKRIRQSRNIAVQMNIPSLSSYDKQKLQENILDQQQNLLQSADLSFDRTGSSRFNKQQSNQQSPIIMKDEPQRLYMDAVLNINRNRFMQQRQSFQSSQEPRKTMNLPQLSPMTTPFYQNNKKYQPIHQYQKDKVQQTVILPFKQLNTFQDNQLNHFYPFVNQIHNRSNMNSKIIILHK
ncbi:protein kinase domain containing protein [Stylonychia lemnae]|uniref:non-specific serine/threonine protein kinase n=1 Tax=Stylonychia lemnae TaxID=5949 RepID=A0A078AXQ3_STYLE|nr:protein kinase domain containing protein [Stylonychia lemnae]|eukprot:CDW86934.1 protein kinase domain containing protein [Stylonychia lemnae]